MSESGFPELKNLQNKIKVKTEKNYKDYILTRIKVKTKKKPWHQYDVRAFFYDNRRGCQMPFLEEMVFVVLSRVLWLEKKEYHNLLV